MTKYEWQSALLAARWDPMLPRSGEPKVLDAWLQLLGGWCAHFGGSGRAVWLTVGEEGWLASDQQPGLGCVKTLGG